MQAQPPKEPGVAGAVPVAGPARQLGALGGGGETGRTRPASSRSPRCHRSTPRWRSIRISVRINPACGTEPFVVASLARQIREQVAQMLAGVSQPACLGREAQQRLHHRHRHEFRIRQLRCDPHRWAPRRQARVILHRVVDTHVQCSRGASRSASIEPPRSIGLATPIVDALAASNADPWNHSSSTTVAR